MHNKLKILAVLFISGLSCVGAGLVNPTITPVGGGGGSGLSSNAIYNMIQTYAPTNSGITAAQAGTQIAATNNTILTNLYINQINGVGTNPSLGSLTIVQGAYTNRYYANGSILRSNNIAPFDWEYHNTNGTYTKGTGSVTRIQFDVQGNLSLPQGGGGGTVLAQTGNFSQGLNAGAGGFVVNAAGTTITTIGNQTNQTTVNTTGNGTNYSGLYVLGTFSASAANLTAGTLPITVADSSWMSLTQAVAYSNSTGLPVVGNALVIKGTNTFGAILVGPTNWPSGGGGSGNFSTNSLGVATFSGSAGGVVIQTNSNSGPGIWTYPVVDSTYGNGTMFVDGSATTPYTGSLFASNAVFSGSAVFSNSVSVYGGTVSVIPTNAALVVPVATASGTSLPIGITNATAGRGTPIVQYFLVDAVTGVAKITCSNEMTGEKLFRSPGSLALIDTNFFTLPITSTNAVWRVRDESSGTGTSVGVITNWIDL